MTVLAWRFVLRNDTKVSEHRTSSKVQSLAVFESARRHKIKSEHVENSNPWILTNDVPALVLSLQRKDLIFSSEETAVLSRAIQSFL